ncbi:MAG: adenine phosphoribosyltransferase [Verrucomicrobia bacterium]|nr:adenine phosphoribosyltransferase [Verrucomicrobiota bacterium]MCH8527361.1 adenine phosphoribosyltransferase [Kiritimatiellia bacterium]
MNAQILQDAIRDIPDFPKPGIVFKDITPILHDPVAYRAFIDLLIAEYKDRNLDAIVAVDARGFLFGGALAYALGVSLVPVRKKGKLPFNTHEISYELEYGTATLEIHDDALSPGDRVLILDDLLATGGTVEATISLCKGLGAEVVGCAFLLELSFLGGRERLGGVPVFVPVVV